MIRHVCYVSEIFVFTGDNMFVRVHIHVEEIAVVAHVAEGIGLWLDFICVSKYLLE